MLGSLNQHMFRHGSIQHNMLMPSLPVRQHRQSGMQITNMMQPRVIPRKTKQRRPKSVFRPGVRSNTECNLQEGTWGLVSKTPCWLTGNQIEAVRKILLRMIREGGKSTDKRVIVRAEVRHPITAKTAGTRMGGGKGGLDHWVLPVVPHMVLFEVVGFEDNIKLQKKALRTCSDSLPCDCYMVTKNKEPSELNLNHVAESEVKDELDVQLDIAKEAIKRTKIKKQKQKMVI